VVNLTKSVLDGCASGLFGDYWEGLRLLSLDYIELYSFFSLINYMVHLQLEPGVKSDEGVRVSVPRGREGQGMIRGDYDVYKFKTDF
jgi:hypothetical protein